MRKGVWKKSEGETIGTWYELPKTKKAETRRRGNPRSGD